MIAYPIPIIRDRPLKKTNQTAIAYPFPQPAIAPQKKSTSELPPISHKPCYGERSLQQTPVLFHLRLNKQSYNRQCDSDRNLNILP